MKLATLRATHGQAAGHDPVTDEGRHRAARRRTPVVVVTLLAVTIVSACSGTSTPAASSGTVGSSTPAALSGSVSSAASSGSAGSSASSASSASPGSSGSSASSGVDTAAAEAAIAPFIGKPSALPVTEALGGKLPVGTKFAFLQCSTTICGLTAQLLGPAVKAVGGDLVIINAGGTASTSQAAAASALELKPAVVIVTGVQLAQFGGKLKELSAAGIKVVSVSVTEDVAPYGVTFNYIGLDFNVNAGKLMADWVVARKGAAANVVFYKVPELSFSTPMADAFKAELTKLCASCQFRTSDISVLTFGTKAPSTVVTDLQSHSDSTVAVFASAEIAAGLPAALKAAGINKLTSIGFAPTPNTLGDIKTGELTAGLGIDLQVAIWTSVDVAARLILGKELTAGEKAGETPEQILEQKDITFDTTRGYAGYPDVSQTYTKFWAS